MGAAAVGVRGRIGGRCGRLGACAVLVWLLAACHTRYSGAPGTVPGERVVNVYNLYDYIQPELLRRFESESGITVRYNVFDSSDTLEARLLAGHSGYDVIFPSGASLQRLIPTGTFRPLERSRLPNARNLDPQIMQRLAADDPGNQYAIAYAWGITGIAYDLDQVRARMPRAPVDSWSMLFDPKVAAHLADCGIGLYESPGVIVSSVLAWLGERPDSEDPLSLQRAGQALMAVRPYIRTISSGSLVADLASGTLCVIIASGGDALQAQERIRVAGRSALVRYVIPREGAVMWFDVAAIPADAPHVDNAYRFLDFLLDARVAADNTNAIGFPNGNRASQPLLRPELTNARSLPDAAVAARLMPQRPGSEAYVRLRTRVWTRFRTGK